MLTGAARKAFEAARNARKHDVRPQVIRLPRGKQRRVHLRLVDDFPERPKTRGDCANGPRPCPWVSCRHHLYLEVNERTGSIKLYRPELEPEELVFSCALDVAEAGGATLEEVASLLNVTRERVRQIEDDACEKIEPFMESWRLFESE